ncbi:hypothetical protein, partial [Streptomyces sp. CO7]
MDLDAVAQELYGMPPEEFTGVRDERAARAREEGDRELAKRIKALRRPTLSAWACNLLVRERKEETEPLLRLGEALRQAHHDLDGGVLRDLSRQQHLLVSALARQAVELSAAAGHRVGEGAREEIEGTLRAVLADPEAAEAWAGGRLTKPLAAAPGFGAALGGGTPPDLRLVPTPEAEGEEPGADRGGTSSGRRGKGGASDAGGPTQRGTAGEEKRRTRQRAAAEREAAEREAAEREAAEQERRRELEEARAQAEEAARALGEAQEETAGADRAAQDAADRVAALGERVLALEEELHAARAESREARAEERAAHDRARAAVRTLRD